MKSLLSRFGNHITLILVVAIIGLVNYRFGTYLTGWDNLQTELAPTLAVKRAVFAVWQEYQSFGLVGGMAHASDLLRAVGVWAISLIMPQSLIRHVVHIGMLAVGGLGMFKLLGQERKSSHPEQSEGSQLPFIGSLFYILNFATVQLFFLPFEPFSIFFASLPWLIWIFLRTVSEISPRRYALGRNDIVLLFLINVLATPSFYVQTLFVVYMLVLGVIGAWHLFSRSEKAPRVNRLKKLIVAFFLIIIANLFWILPQVYFLAQGGSQTVENAKINQLATQDVQLQNKARGNMSSFATFKGFYYDLKGTDQKPLFEPWHKHLENPVVQIASWSVFAIILLGITRKSTYRAPFVGIWLLCAVALLSNTPIFSQLNELISRNSFIAQMFRAPFTKFAVPWALVSSYFFMQGLAVILNVVKNLGVKYSHGDPSVALLSQDDKAQQSVGSILLTIISLILIAIVSFPVFTGNLFSQHVRVKIPADYFQTIEYFRTVPKDNRIALLPQDSFWGWYHYSWGYAGSGFLWYGIEQPIVSPTFDVWSTHSESYLWEMKHALALGEASKVAAVLKKYNIHYVLIDKSVLAQSTHQKAFLANKVQELLATNEFIQHEKTFGAISIYKVKNAVPFVTQLTSIPVVGSQSVITNDDTAYAIVGHYRSPLPLEKERFDYYFPFIDVFSQKKLTPPTWKLTENANTFSLTTQLPFTDENYSLFSNADTSLLQGTMQERALTVSFQKHSYVSIDTTKATPVQCQKFTVCITYSLPDITHDQAYIVRIKNENIRGQRLFFYAQSETTGSTIIEDRLSEDVAYYILPTGNRYSRGYVFGFQNDSYEGLASENALISLQVYRMPLEQLKALYFAPAGTQGQPTNSHNLPFESQVLSVGKQETIVYNQAYNSGWKAYINGQELKHHVKVNNWSNGWVVPAGTKGAIRVFFWPQLLEYIGFGAIGLLGISIIVAKVINHPEA